MRLDSRLFDSVRIRKPRRAEDAENAARFCCEWPSCALPATHRAPLARKEERRARANGKRHYRRFCLHHVRIYNSSYDYFAGMSNHEINAFRQASLTGLRPTWIVGQQGATSRHVAGEWLRRRIRNLLESWHAGEEAQSGRESGPAPGGAFKRRGFAMGNGRNLLPADMEALQTLGFVASGRIPPGDEIKARYKSLVKRFHPDSRNNVPPSAAEEGGASHENAACGDRLIRILRAHDHLKARAFL